MALRSGRELMSWKRGVRKRDQEGLLICVDWVLGWARIRVDLLVYVDPSKGDQEERQGKGEGASFAPRKQGLSTVMLGQRYSPRFKWPRKSLAFRNRNVRRTELEIEMR